MSLTTNVTSAGGAVTVAFAGELDISRAASRDTSTLPWSKGPVASLCATTTATVDTVSMKRRWNIAAPALTTSDKGLMFVPTNV